MKRRRVVITGLGIVAPNGIGKDDFWRANIKGKSGVGLIKHFDVSNFSSKIAAQIKNFDPLDFMPKEVAKRSDRFVHLGLAAAHMAINDSSLRLEKEDKQRIGVFIGSGLGGVPFHEEQILAGYQKGFHRVHPLSVPKITPNAVSSYIAIEHGLTGPNMVISTACASGTYAVTEAFNKIVNSDAEVILAGGAEAPLTEFTFGAYDVMRVLSRRNDAPEAASRPFDRERDGFVIGEGAGILVLEELSHALSRNAHIYAEILGYGANSGAYHMVIPNPEGNDVADVMRQALNNAEISYQEIDYINAHGTSTLANDQSETRGIKQVFREQAYNIHISSTKSMIGHTIGAAGAIEAIVCALVVEHSVIPPTINYTYPDPECDLDYVPNSHRNARVNYVLSNSFGFGNCNCCLIIGRYKEGVL